MVIRLRNQENPGQVLLLTYQSWWELLDLAELYGWNPLGPLMAGEWSVLDLGPDDGYLPGGSTRFVEQALETNQVIPLEDALNLADALERAFMEYEPVRVPADYYLFEPSDLALRRRPGIGAMAALIEFCRAGRFLVECVQYLTRA